MANPIGTNINLEKSVKRIEDKVTKLVMGNKDNVYANSRQTWVRVSVITEVTGWDKAKLRKARLNNLVLTRKTVDNRIEYLLESINPMFLKSEFRVTIPTDKLEEMMA
jgi:hypothetical protein